MKSYTRLFIGGLLALCASCLFTGCASYADKLRAFDELGIKSAEITGKFSYTKYTRTDKDGTTTSTLKHNNAWVPMVEITRERPTPTPKTGN